MSTEKPKKFTVSASIEREQAMELFEHAIKQQRSVRQLAGFAIAEWLQRNRNGKHKRGTM